MEPRGLATGPNGEAYILEGASGGVYEFSSSGTQIGHIAGTPSGPFTETTGIAVDSADNVYVVQLYGPPVIDQFNASGAFEGPVIGTPSGNLNEPRAVAANANGGLYVADQREPSGVVDIFGPAVLASALIDAESFSDVGTVSVTLGAQVNDLGISSSYYYEYGPNTSYGSTTPTMSLGAVNGDVGAPAQVSGLQPGTKYHFRVVVVNEQGTTHGADVTFTASPSGLLGLPDERGYEMVTPPSNQDAEVYPLNPGRDIESNAGQGIAGTPTLAPSQSASNGEAVVYAGSPTSGGNGSSGGGLGNEYLATRSPTGKWTQANIMPAGYKSPAYLGFSDNLETGVLNSCDLGLPPLAAAPDGYPNVYTRNNRDGNYQALVNTVPPNRTALEFGAFHTEITFGYCKGAVSLGGAYVGASSNFEHVLFLVNDALTSSATENPPTERQNDLYDSVAGKLSLVNVLPDGKAEANATFGGVASPEANGPIGGVPLPEAFPFDFSHAISADGSRIFWSALETSIDVFGQPHFQPKALYVRENDTQPQSPLGSKGECTVPTDACTVQIDASRGGPAGSGGGGRFWGATSDGSKVFFTDCSRLTSDSTAISGNGCLGTETNHSSGKVPILTGSDLYEYDVASGQLIDLTIDNNISDSLGADVQGVLGISEASKGGAYVYFVADGVLTNAQNTAGQRPVGDQPNLYMVHHGETIFITTLSPTDGAEASPFGSGGEYPIGDWQSDVGHHTARVTPDGRDLVFVSTLSLTGYPNEGLTEVYRYDAETRDLTCASCNPSGEAPSSSVNEAEAGFAAAFLPLSWNETYLPHWISDDGSRVFFDSAQPLVPQDKNNVEDVYEWERDGAGSCRDGAGCVYLLSGGTSTADSLLLDASASGNDVFIVTRAQLVPQDGNENFDLYDARVGAVQPLSPSACSGTGCQGVPPAPPIFATPSSATFNGVGNVRLRQPSSPVRSPSSASGALSKSTPSA